MKPQFKLKFQGKTAVMVDWANVYYWKDSLKKEIDPRKLYTYFKDYSKVKEIGFYFGTDPHPLSKELLRTAKSIGYRVITKPVKYLPKIAESGEKVWVRKRDFDLEIGLDCFEELDRFDGFVILSGDGDFATLYERLIKKGKQVIVVYAHGHLGREVWQIERGLFKVAIDRLSQSLYKKMPPRRRRGAQLGEVYQKERKLSR